MLMVLMYFECFLLRTIEVQTALKEMTAAAVSPLVDLGAWQQMSLDVPATRTTAVRPVQILAHQEYQRH